MSQMLSRTWSYIQGLGAEPGWSVPSPNQRHSLPPSLFNWLQQVSGCLTGEEERVICHRQLELIGSKLSQPGVSSGVLSDCMVRVIYMSLLGYDCSSIFIHCVKLAGTGSILHRKMGYLACSVVLPGTHQLSLLVTNTILQDLSSSSVVDVQLGLVAAANIVQQPLAQLVPVLLPTVKSLVGHSSPLVRRKTLVLLHHLCSLSPNLWTTDVGSVVVGAMSDSNPGVVTTALQVTSRSAGPNDDEVTVNGALAAALHLHEQLEGDKLPEDFLYQGKHSAPWVRMDLARLFRAVQNKVDARPELASQVKSILTQTLEQSGGRGGKPLDLVVQSLLYETVLTVSELDVCMQDQHLVTLALRQVSGLLQAKQHCSIYAGLVALQALFIRQPPCLSPDQERSVVACLSHPDPAIQKRTVQLMVTLASKDNVANVVNTIISFVRNQRDVESLSAVIDQVANLVDKWGEDIDWKASTLVRLVQVSKGDQRDKMCEKLKFLLAPMESGEEVDAASELELNRVRDKLRMLLGGLVSKGMGQCGKLVPTVVVGLYVWCETQFISEESNKTDITDRLLELGKLHLDSGNIDVVQQVLWSILRIYPSSTASAENACDYFLEQCCKSSQRSVSQTAEDVQRMLSFTRGAIERSLERPADWTLNFLDRLVIDKLSVGCEPYIPSNLRLVNVNRSRSTMSSSEKPLNLNPYRMSPKMSLSTSSGDLGSRGSASGTSSVKLWTMEGRLGLSKTVNDVHKDDKSDLNLKNTDITVVRSVASLESVLADDWS